MYLPCVLCVPTPHDETEYCREDASLSLSFLSMEGTQESGHAQIRLYHTLVVAAFFFFFLSFFLGGLLWCASAWAAESRAQVAL